LTTERLEREAKWSGRRKASSCDQINLLLFFLFFPALTILDRYATHRKPLLKNYTKPLSLPLLLFLHNIELCQLRSTLYLII